MGYTEVLQLGNRVDIKPADSTVMTEAGKISDVCRSSISDILSDTEIAITMPVQGAKMVLFPVGVECDVIYYTRNGMYRGNATVKGRFREGNLYFLSVVLRFALRKYQRREYFRINYSADVKYYEIREALAMIRTTDQLIEALHKPDETFVSGSGTIQDISGGGMRFLSNKGYERDAFVFLIFHMNNDHLDETMFLVCQIMGSDPHPSIDGLYSNRGKFIYKDLRDREKIVRFVFEEDRRMRKKEMGG